VFGIPPIAIVAVVAVIAIVVLFKLIWKVAEANEALVISGLGAGGEKADGVEGLGFKIVVGTGTVVLPGFQVARRFPLDSKSTVLTTKAVSNQSIPLNVKAVVAYKVGDDLISIANAARRFLDQSEEVMRNTIHEIFEGHLRAIVGGMSVEDMLHKREELTANIRASLADDLAKLGLVVDSLQIKEIDDESGYIVALGQPQAAAVAAKARIAAAQRDEEATRAEQLAAAAKAESIRESSIKQAGYQAEVDKAAAEAAQAGPLAEAEARQEVVKAETAAAELDAARTEKVLDTQVRRPADAEAYRQVTLADADRKVAIARAEADAQTTTLKGQAEASATEATGRAQAAAIEAKGLAEAAGIEARARALATNPDAVVAQQIAENYPEIVRSAAESLGSVGNMIVLNGADGIEQTLASLITAGGAGFGLVKQMMAGMTPEPAAQPVAAVPAPAVPVALPGADATSAQSASVTE